MQYETQTKEGLDEAKKKKKRERKAKKEQSKKSLFMKVFQYVIPTINVKERLGKKDEIYILETKDKQRVQKEVSALNKFA